MAGATAESHGLSRIGAAEEVRALHFPRTSWERHKWHKQTKTQTHTLIEPRRRAPRKQEAPVCSSGQVVVVTDEGVALQQKLEIHRSEFTPVKLAPLLPSSGLIEPVLHPRVSVTVWEHIALLRVFTAPSFFPESKQENENMFSGRRMFTVILHSSINSPASSNGMFARILNIIAGVQKKAL